MTTMEGKRISNLSFNVLLPNYANHVCRVIDCHYLAEIFLKHLSSQVTVFQGNVPLKPTVSSGNLLSDLYKMCRFDASPCRCDPQTAAEGPVAAESRLHHVTLQRRHQ